jgi:ketosteroid isomerase-like protein
MRRSRRLDPRLTGVYLANVTINLSAAEAVMSRRMLLAIFIAVLALGLATRPAVAQPASPSPYPLPAGTLALGAPASQAADADAIRNEFAAWRSAFDSRNVNAVCDIFAPDLRLDAGPLLDDTYSRLCARLQRILKDPEATYKYSLAIREILIFGDIAIVRPVWTLTVTREGEPSAIVTTEPGLDVMRRERNGTWRIFRFMAYTVPQEPKHP